MIAVVIVSGGGDSHTVSTVVPTGGYLQAGYQIRAAGRPVGRVKSVSLTRDHRAKIVMRLDDSVWPVPRDSRIFVRTGGTIRLNDRYLNLVLGKSTETLPDGGTFPGRRFVVPVEFEDVFTMFGDDERRDLRSFVNRAGNAMTTARQPLRRTVEAAPSAFRQVSNALADLGGDPRALDALIRESDRVLAAVGEARPGMAQLIDGASATLAATGSQARDVQAALEQAPGTLRDLTGTLSRADGTLKAANRLSVRLRPGAEALRTLPAPVHGVLARLLAIRPAAQQALAHTRLAAPDLQTMLARTENILPTLGEASKKATKQLDCIRPYAPEIAGFASDWGAGAWSRGDRNGKYVRAVLGASQIPYVTPATSKDLHKLVPSVKKVQFRPPGQLVDQPWFQPQCGIGPEVLSPDYDPEATGFDPLSRLRPGATKKRGQR